MFFSDGIIIWCPTHSFEETKILRWDDLHRRREASEFATSPGSACGSCKVHVDYLQATRGGLSVRVCRGTLNGRLKDSIASTKEKSRSLLCHYLKTSISMTFMKESPKWRLSPMPPSPQWMCFFRALWLKSFCTTHIDTHFSVSKETKLWNDSWMMIVIVMRIIMILTARWWEWS